MSLDASPRSTMPLTSFAWRNLWRNPRRTGILLLVFTLGITSMLVFHSLMQAWSKSMLDNALSNLTNELQIHQPGFTEDPTVEKHFLPSDDLKNRLDSLPVDWAERVKVFAMIQSERESIPITLIGIEPEKEKQLSFIGSSIVKGGYFDAEDAKGVLIGQKLLDRLETKLNRRVVLMSQADNNKLGEIGIRVTGVYRHSDPKMEEQLVFIPIDQAQKLLKLKHGIHEIALNLHDNGQKAPLVKIQTELQQLAPKLDIETWWQREPFIEATNKLMDSFIYVWLGFIMLLMIFGMLNTLLMSLFERHQEFQTLNTLGMKPRQIRILVLIEMLWLALVSSVLALAISLTFVLSNAEGINLQAYAEGMAMFGATHMLYLKVEPVLWLETLFVTVLITLLFSLWPILRATNYRNLRVR